MRYFLSLVMASKPLLIAGLVALVAMEWAHADSIDYQFGTVQNSSQPWSPGGICVAASFINGATYLENAFPSVYGGTLLATGSAGTPAAATLAFGGLGWSANSTSYQGYYSRVNTTGDVFGDWWQTMIDWTESYAPGRTTYSGEVAAWINGENPATWTMGSNVADYFPVYDYLRDAVTHNAFTELAIYGYTISGHNLSIVGGHAIDMADITYSNDTYTLWYQDPNNPTHQFYSAPLDVLYINGDPAFTFYDPYTFGATPVFLAAAFTMSAVPEPSSVLLFLLGGAGILIYRRTTASRSTARSIPGLHR